MSRRSRIVGFGSAALLVLAGAVCAALVGGGLGPILALVLISLGCVEAVSLVFAEVGFSEDRERARAQAARERERARAQAAPERERAGPARDPRRTRRPRLERARGRQRRLR